MKDFDIEFSQFNLMTTMPTITYRNCCALYGSARRNFNAAIKHLLKTGFGMKPGQTLLFISNIPVVTLSGRSYQSRSIKLTKDEFSVECDRGIVAPALILPSVSLCTDCLFSILTSLKTRQRHGLINDTDIL